jgi:single-strand DNA-binding protein
MNETVLTVRGNVGGNVTLRRAGETPVANFRLGCTPSHFNRAGGYWVDDETQWYTVNAWRRLGEHCAASLNRGDPVVVHGRLSVKKWVNSENIEQTTLEIEALSVGHDLTRGTSRFTKMVRSEQPAPSVPSVPPVPSDEGTGAEVAA